MAPVTNEWNFCSDCEAFLSTGACVQNFAPKMKNCAKKVQKRDVEHNWPPTNDRFKKRRTQRGNRSKRVICCKQSDIAGRSNACHCECGTHPTHDTNNTTQHTAHTQNTHTTRTLHTNTHTAHTRNTHTHTTHNTQHNTKTQHNVVTTLRK
jgi:hypothetical protein